jgi:hypothetical protein
MRVLVSLLVLIGLHNTLQCVKRYVMKPNVVLGDPNEGIACLVNPFGHKQYPLNSLDQNNSAHGVTV